MELAFPSLAQSPLDGKPTKDFAPISLSYARTRGHPNGIEVAFSTAVDPFTATNRDNYSVNPGVTVIRAALETNGHTVWLSTTTLTNGVTHRLSVSNVQDLATPPNVLPANSSVLIQKGQGVLTRRVFTDLPWCYLECLTNDVRFPDRPSWTDYPEALESPQQLGDGYGLQLAGYIHPPISGEYMFYLAGDEQARLFLSTDEDPSHKVLVADLPTAVNWREYNLLPAQRSGYVPLQEGKAYYVEVLLAEGGGNDHVSVAWRVRGLPDPANGDPPVPGLFLSSLTPSGPASIAVPPLSTNVAERGSASFWVQPAGTPPYTYQWLRAGVPIPGANAANYSLPLVLASDHRVGFAVVVSNWFSSVTSAAAVLTVNADRVPPVLTRVSGNATLDGVTLTFSEPVTPATAMDARNYQLSSGLSVNGVRLLPDQSNVVLLTTAQTAGQTYSLAVTGVTDTAAVPNQAGTSSNFTAWGFSRGFLHRQAYYELPGIELADLLWSQKYPDWPDWSGYVPAGEIPPNVHDYNMGERLVGYVLPPLDGFYIFYLCADAHGALYLGTDENPATKRLIAREPAWNPPRYWNGPARRNPLAPENRSAAIYLQAGRKYYVEAVMKNDCCEDNLGFAWQPPGSPPPDNGAPPVPGAYLATHGDPTDVSLAIVQQPRDAAVDETAPASFSIVASSGWSPVFYQWQRNGADVDGANSAAYELARPLRGDHLTRFRCLVSVPGKMLMSEEAVLTVRPDNTAPQVLSAATLAGRAQVGVCFSEPMDPASVTNPAHYALSTGGGVTGAALRTGGDSVFLTVNVLAFTNYTLAVNGAKDLAGNALPPNTVVPVTMLPLEARDLGWPGPPVERGSVFTCAPGQIEMLTDGGAFSDTSDRGHFVYQAVEGDFDAAVRIESYAGANCSSLAGLMARQDLTAGSPAVNVIVFPPDCATRYEALARLGRDGALSAWPPPNQHVFPGGGVSSPNAWMRLTRTNHTFTAYASTNGTDWIQFSQLTSPFTNRLFVGLANFAQNYLPGALSRVSWGDYRLAASLLPMPKADLLVKKASDSPAAFALNDIYQVSPVGAQAPSQWAHPTNPAEFTLQVQNDGLAPGSFVVRAFETNDGNWSFTCHAGSSNVTAHLTNAAGLTLSELPLADAEYLTVVFTPKARAPGGATKSALVAVFTDSDVPTPCDTVKLTVINEISRQPDLMVRRVMDVNYTGDDVYSFDGSGQTKQSLLEPGATAVYPLQVSNDGNLTNTFVLQGTGGTEGRSVQYFDALIGGADMTAELLAGTKFLTLLPGASWEFRAEITSEAALGNGTSQITLVTATAVVSPDQQDTVKMLSIVTLATNVPQAGVFTLDADFNLGVLAGTAFGNDSLFLAQQLVTLPYLWVPNSHQGSVSKLDTRTGQEVARYLTGPPSAGNGSPSRTTLDQAGNCWVVNRTTGTIIKIGLYENGACVDRNGDGVIQTSQDLNGDGDITGEEILPWGEDECVLYEVVLIPDQEGVFSPGAYPGPYAFYPDTSGPRSVAADAFGNVWAGNYSTMKYYYVDGETGRILRTNDFSSVNHSPYGAVVDANGNLWSAGAGANHILRWDGADSSFLTIPLPHMAYGLGLDRGNHLFISGWNDARLSRLSVSGTNLDWTVPASAGLRGVAVTADGDVWMAASFRNSVLRYDANGIFKVEIPVGARPTGVSVDAAGKVWVVDLNDENVHRLDPATDRMDLTKRVVNGNHYGYSDMTGHVARNITVRYGTWTVRHDARLAHTHWGKLTWHADDPAGSATNIVVRVRSSDDRRWWSAWEKAVHGLDLAATPPGRWLEIEVALRAHSGQPSPTLLDLTAEPLPQRTSDLAVWQAVQPGTVIVEDEVTFTVNVTNRGPQEARGVILSNWLGAGAEVVAVSSSQGRLAQTGAVVRCDLGPVGVQSNVALTLRLRPTLAGSLTNLVHVFTYEVDPVLENNTSVLSTRVLRPALTIRRTEPGRCVVSWPVAESTNFILQSSARLDGGWQTATEAPVQAGNEFQATVPPTGPGRFYRLHRP